MLTILNGSTVPDPNAWMICDILAIGAVGITTLKKVVFVEQGIVLLAISNTGHIENNNYLIIWVFTQILI